LKDINNGEFNLSQNNLKNDFELLSQALDAFISGIIITDNRLS